MVRIFNQYVSLKLVLLGGVEALLTFLALLCGAKLRFLGEPSEFAQYTALPGFGLQTGVFVLLFQICFYCCDLYDAAVAGNSGRQAVALVESVGAGFLILGLTYYIFPVLLIGRGVLFISTLLLAGFVALSCAVLDRACAAAFVERAAILGTGELAGKVALEMHRRKDLAIELAGFVDGGVDTGGTGAGREFCGYPVLGGASELERVAAEWQISRIIVAIEDRRGQLPVANLVKLRVQGVRIEDAHAAVAALTGRVWLDTVRPSWFVFSDGFHRSKANQTAKRAIDLALGILGFALTAPAMLALAAAIRLDSKGPAIYRQTRVGLAGRHFDLLKFRSMRADAEALGGAQWAAEDDPRITRVGRFLRKYRLDELPQFLNVIRGEMSFVGPRPERPVFVEQLRRAISYYDERHSVRPGITGWAQVQYRYGANVEDAARKLEYDLFYLKNMSPLFDLAIVLKTVRIVVAGGGR
ncbi:MAG TPA: TIGR03013 family XrtA/PEP-CTERM system glycosyltransferase [Bryobacteraceae bacterium]|nr:TIGR03013 family XrtA/PEP-CTERM system glycosyltransferase [Bryobacteraceae bacterium]